MGTLGLLLTGLSVAAAVLAPAIVPYDPLVQHQNQELVQPGRAFLLGTDDVGRDILSRILYGMRLSLMVGILSVLLGALVGVVSGMTAGYLEGWLDAVTMRLWDSVLAFPPVLVGVAIAALMGPGTLSLCLALALASIPQFARLARASVLVEKQREYVAAARCLGGSDVLILARHIFPNTLSPLLVQLTLAMAFAVLLESGLSFLGIGAQPPEASLGSMLSVARRFLRPAPWYGVFPGLALVVLLLGLNFLSDAARTALDPRRVNA
jgi:peptide/nickel transport system permease protein